MRVLFDQATPVPIRAFLEGHDVRTAAQQGWDTLKNGELLASAEADGFDVLLTTDKNMPFAESPPENSGRGSRSAAMAEPSAKCWARRRSHPNSDTRQLYGGQVSIGAEAEAFPSRIRKFVEIPRLRSGFRLRAPATLTPAKRLKLSPAGPIVLHAKVCGSPSASLRIKSGRCRHK